MTSTPSKPVLANRCPASPTWQSVLLSHRTPQPMRRGGVLPRPICRTLPVISCRAAPMCAAARHALHPQRRGTQAPRLTGVLPTPPPCPAPVGRGALTPPPIRTAFPCHASVGGGVPDAPPDTHRTPQKPCHCEERSDVAIRIPLTFHFPLSTFHSSSPAPLPHTVRA